MAHQLLATQDMTDELGAVMRQMIAHQELSLILPDHLVRNLAMLGDQTGSREATAQAHFSAAIAALSKSELCLALIEYEKGMKKCPYDLGFQYREKGILKSIAMALNEMGKLNPAHPEFGRSYERLLFFGEVGIETHLCAVQHYVANANDVKAKDIGERLFRCGPNMPGLRALLRDIAERTSDRALFAMIGDEVSPASTSREVRSLTPQEAFSLLPILQTVSAHLGEDMCEAVLNVTATVLPKDGELDPALIEFHYARAIALDKLHRIVEAFELFRQIYEARPENPTFARSCLVQSGRLFSAAASMYAQNPLDPGLLPFADALYAHNVLPYWLAESVSLMEIYRGERTFAKKRTEALLQILPNDTDYVKSAMKVAEAFGDPDWSRALLDHISKLRVQRPYDFDLFF